MSNCTRRRVSNKIEELVYSTCVRLSDPLGVCRASNTLLCETTGYSDKSVKCALTQLEAAGRIDRTTYFVRPMVSYRDIRTFPAYYNVHRGLHWCEDRKQYRHLRDGADHKEPAFAEITLEHWRELYKEGGKEESPETKHLRACDVYRGEQSQQV